MRQSAPRERLPFHFGRGGSARRREAVAERFSAWHASRFSGRCPELCVPPCEVKQGRLSINKGSVCELMEIAGRLSANLVSLCTRYVTYEPLQHGPSYSPKKVGQRHAGKVGRWILDTTGATCARTPVPTRRPIR